MKKLVIGAVLALVALFVVARSHANDSLLPVGAPAPEVVGTDAAGKTVKLSASKAQRHVAVVYFYPKDDSGGCTKEACAFRDASADFAKAGVTIFAISRDGDASHKGFRDHNHLPFPMVADTSGAVQHAYGVPSVMPGVDIAARVTFLVGPDGKIARVWPKVDPVANAKEVLDAVATLSAKK